LRIYLAGNVALALGDVLVPTPLLPVDRGGVLSRYSQRGPARHWLAGRSPASCGTTPRRVCGARRFGQS